LLKPVLILCLGNEIVSDDAFGPMVARRLTEGPSPGDGVEVIFAPVAGFRLLDLLTGRRCVLIVDIMKSGSVPPGTLRSFPAGKLTPSLHLTTSHQISLPTALELAQKLGMAMPEVIDVLAVEGQDLETLSEELTPPVAAAVDEALTYIRDWIQRQPRDSA
jgi:hydrogenase maturation protease